MTSIFTADDTGVTNAAQQPSETVIAKACGETCRVRAASMATGAISTAVAEFEMNSPTTAVTRNTAASIAKGPSEPNRATIPCAAICVAPVFRQRRRQRQGAGDQHHRLPIDDTIDCV